LLFRGKGRPGLQYGDWQELFPEIIGRSPTMLKALETVAKISHSDSAVLISGESGTGKELIASAIHRLSSRSARPFVAINCSAIPENLLESELFGHEKGAFTGADRRRHGRFDAASGGTLFLDEIGDMPLALQAKLLRVLQDKKFTPLGGNESRDADVRIVAATNIDLEKAVKGGTFRLDLFYRLNVLPVTLPALRERAEDIPELLEHFLDLSNRMHGYDVPATIGRDAMQALCTFGWPGNVRQLQNMIERLVVLKGGGEINREDLPPELTHAAPACVIPAATMPLAVRHVDSPPPVFPEKFGDLPREGIDLIRFIEGLENSMILQALERTGHNKNQAAKLLGLNRTTLVERIKKRGLAPLNAPAQEL
jgi:transcriptional regulator with PAS, ATPase and Fis domain